MQNKTVGRKIYNNFANLKTQVFSFNVNGSDGLGPKRNYRRVVCDHLLSTNNHYIFVFYMRDKYYRLYRSNFKPNLTP